MPEPKTKSDKPIDEGTDQPLAVFERGLGEEIRVSWNHFRGHCFLNFRHWYQPDMGSELKPTRRGVTFRPEELPELAEAVAQAIKEAETLRD
ncbi:MAG: transcriptional coactivator p15/PC4 family protein [Planctomycetes bacterium]|nr:transcriptional coactivator p15/PC4 family protein [Planctomycetota bacterium]